MKNNPRCKLKYFILSVVLMLFYSFSSAQSKKDFQIYQLWTGGQIPAKAELKELKHVKFRTIKKFEPEVDGYRFLHGVAIARYQDQWVVTFGHNKGAENTGSEEAQSMFSKNGKNWGPLITIANPSGDQAVSHGVLLNDKNTLWSFNACFKNIMKEMQTNAYSWDNENKKWVLRGKAVADGFWPLQQPLKMENGEWIMAGAYFGKKGTVPAVAICKEDNFLHWEVKTISTPVNVWGECTVIPDGANVLLISRSSNGTPRFKGYSHPLAWVSLSKDYGHTWSELQPANLPMAASKPYAGILSTGQRYLIGTTTADSKNARRPLTIAVSKPGENTFSKIYCIRKAVHKKGKVESDPKASLAYPYAIEYKDHLYVVYSNSGGRGGSDRSQWNNNSAELAIIPVKELKAE